MISGSGDDADEDDVIKIMQLKIKFFLYKANCSCNKYLQALLMSIHG
mgnify:CR=1